MLRNYETTRKLFDEWAKTYEEDVRKSEGPLFGYDHSLLEASQMIVTDEKSKILDLGIGTGALASLVSKNDDLVWGIDLSEEMLRQCKMKHPKYHLSQGTFTEMGCASASFDLVISSFCFHEVLPSERDKACKEVFRVLKPGGKLLLLDIMFASHSAMYDAERRIGDYWDDSEEYPIVGNLDELLRKTGFTNLLWRQTTPYHWAVTAQR
jgi:putative AdoMet-dependent methyltransferase